MFMLWKGGLLQMEKKEEKLPISEKKKAHAAVTSNYECTKNCFTCPFPGAKCVTNPCLWNHLT